MRVIGYVRVSTREQADSRLGLDAQRRALTEEAARRGWDLELIEDAGYTARSVNRPGLRRALRALRTRQADALVVAKLDRLSRSVQHFATFLAAAQRQKWSIVVLDLGIDMTNPNGRLVANILASVAQWESEMIGTRTADAMAEAKASRGVTYGRERMTDDATVARIRALRADGLSFGKIAAALDADSTPTPNGGQRWYPSTVARIHKAAA
ncbi:MAG: recombinase family protein [Actinobacteria bacterium]|nr:recombinase family protein [Actinomycetota bacterium]